MEVVLAKSLVLEIKKTKTNNKQDFHGFKT